MCKELRNIEKKKNTKLLTEQKIIKDKLNLFYFQLKIMKNINIIEYKLEKFSMNNK